MILGFLLKSLVALVAAIFSIFPTVDKIPSIGGFDIDTELLKGIGTLNTILDTFWPLKILMNGFLFILAYYGVKILIRLFLGSRSPV